MDSSPYGEGGPPVDNSYNASADVEIVDLENPNYQDAPTTARYHEVSAGVSTAKSVNGGGDSAACSGVLTNSTTVVRNSDKPQIFNTKKLHMYNSNLFYVYIEKSNNLNIGRLHPMVIGHLLLKKLNIKNIIAITKAGLNRIKVQVKSANDANSIITNTELRRENLRAFIPSNLLSRKGVIRNVDTWFDNEYLLTNIESQGKVIEVSRLNRRVIVDGNLTYKPTQSVILTFEGNVLPPHVVINGVFCRVETFIHKVTQCFKCLGFGHVAKQCRSVKNLCTNCGANKTEGHSCSVEDKYCITCKSSNHNSTSKSCPEFSKQEQIKKYMAVNNIGYVEAKECLENSYANTLSCNNRFQQLDTLGESNFPRLPINNIRYNNNTRPLSFSQPIRSNVTVPSSNKKRKAMSPPPKSTIVPPMFPFVFGPSKPLPNNPYRPTQIETMQKEELLQVITNWFSGYLNNIENIDDLKRLSRQSLSLELDKLLSTIPPLRQSSSQY